jgi:hypothetical protein
MRIAVFLLLLALGPAAAAEWSSFDDPGGYAVDVPPGFTQQADAGNSDGRTFRSDDGTQLLSVVGGIVPQAQFEAAIAAAMEEARQSGWALVDERVTPGWASYAARRRGMVRQARMVALCGGSRYAGFAIDYPERDVRIMDQVVERLGRSLRASNTCP